MRKRAGAPARSKAVKEIQAGLKRLSRGFRLLPGRQKAKVRAMRARRGVEAAIRMAREMRRDR
jgi:hypothetical protein